MSETFWARVIKNYSDFNMVTLVLQAPEGLSSPYPGQFYLLKTGEFLDPFLRRPFSISQFDKPDLITFRFGVKGKGTAWLAKSKKGDKIELLGPLGNGFNLKGEGQPLLVGGGLGIAPLVYLAQYFLEKEGKTPKVVLGTASQKDLRGLKVFLRLGLSLLIATEDGSYGKKGIVSDVLPSVLAQGDEIFACGPRPMLYYISQIAAKNHLKCQVALEEVMACGVGACLGCVTAVQDQGELSYARVCKEGPVFESSKVVW